MMRLWPQSRSLLWTFATAFLVVLVVAAAVQGWLVVTVVRPITERLQEAEWESLGRASAEALSDSLRRGVNVDIRAFLASRTSEEQGAFLLFRSSSGEVVPGRRFPRPGDRPFPDLPQQFPPPDSTLFPSGPDSMMPGPGREPFDRRFTTRYPISTDSGVIGEVVLATPRRGGGPGPDVSPWFALLTLPVAVILAGLAGFVMFRLLLRRIRALEGLALQVAEGDFAVRVPASGRDEIDRLGAQFNRMTERLSTSRERVERMDRQRRQLLADISHELATPLTSIRGSAETLLRPGVDFTDAERSQYIEAILDESRRMALLVDDLLELARLESGGAVLNLERLDLDELCRNTVRRFHPHFAAAGLQLLYNATDKPHWIVADGRRLEQLLENLLGNTLRYVPSGGTVSVTLEEVATTDAKRLRLTVADTGAGFLPDDLPHVFDRFYRGDTARTGPGTGLGLAIVKEIARSHGGLVHAENRVPRGASIIVELPADKGLSAS